MLSFKWYINNIIYHVAGIVGETKFGGFYYYVFGGININFDKLCSSC